MKYLHLCQELLAHDNSKILFEFVEDCQSSDQDHGDAAEARMWVHLYGDIEHHPTIPWTDEVTEWRRKAMDADHSITTGKLVRARVFPGRPQQMTLCLVVKDYKDALGLGLLLVRPMEPVHPDKETSATVVVAQHHCEHATTAENPPAQNWTLGPAPGQAWVAPEHWDTVAEQAVDEYIDGWVDIKAVSGRLYADAPTNPAALDPELLVECLGWWLQDAEGLLYEYSDYQLRVGDIVYRVDWGKLWSYDYAYGHARAKKKFEPYGDVFVIIDELRHNDLGLVIVHPVTMRGGPRIQPYSSRLVSLPELVLPKRLLVELDEDSEEVKQLLHEDSGCAYLYPRPTTDEDWEDPEDPYN